MPHNRVVSADHPSPSRLVSAPLAMAGVMVLVAAVGEFLVVPSESARRVDLSWVERARGWVEGRPTLEGASLVWADLSGPWVVHPLVLLLAIVLVLAGRAPRRSLLVVPVGLVGWGLGALCKLLVARPRPEPDVPITAVDSFSYPSGHATNIALGAVVVLALLRTIRRRRIRWPATALVLVIAVLTALNRLALGVHFVSDVLAGLVLGAVMAIVGLWVIGDVVTPPSRPQMRWWRARAKR